MASIGTLTRARPPSTVAPVEDERRHWTLTLALIAAVVAVSVEFVLPDLFDSLRHDENLTAWIIGDGLGEAISRSWEFQGQSPVYFAMLWGWTKIAGGSDLAMRLPSLAASIVAAEQLVRLGQRLDSRRTGEVAGVFLFGLQVGASDARPYAFLVLAVVVAARLGFAWVDDPKLSIGLLWALALAFSAWMHPFAAYAFLPHAFLAVRRFDDPKARRQIAGLTLFGVLLMAPIVPQVLDLGGRQSGLVIVDGPPVPLALILLIPSQLGVAAAVALAIRPFERRMPDPLSVHFVSSLAIAPGIALYAQSHLTGNSVYLDRYWSPSLPAIALIAAMIATRAPRATALSVVAFAVTASMTLTSAWSYGWSGASDYIEAQPADTKVWAMVGFIESADPAYPTSAERIDYLNSPLRHHGVERDLVVLPMFSDEIGLTRIRELVDGAVRNRERVLVFTLAGQPRDGGTRARELLEDAGFSIVEAEQFDGLRTWVLEP